MPDSLDLERLADQWEPRLRDAFLKAIEDAAGRINISELERLIAEGRVFDALRLVGLDPGDFSEVALVQAQMFNETGIATANNIPPIRQAAVGYTLSIRFNVRAPAAENWIRERSSTLIREITEDQRVAVRTHLEEGLQRGLNPRTVALDLVGRRDPKTGKRTGGVIGLHSTQERWLVNYSDALESDLPRALQYELRDKRFDRTILKAIKDGTPLPAEIRVKAGMAYANRALKWRADNIARTETIRALGAAQAEAYQQGINDGKIDVNLLTRFWVTAGDERVRATHRMIPGMNKDGVKWGQAFDTPSGPSMHAPHDRDPQCRCHERVRIDYLAPAVRALRNAKLNGR